ncbi:phosphonate C-P lyase system protein PhnH [Antarctobacter heliothermus]|uniref:Alpha-D-ribose 1-methylphosphonate 5-triphosphate synthase subunit PhnH n=1 Tax=Antarctobacter heliothermus TaxID=74033 RepID=A0A239KMJ1_9RHOB|nr:phosphonate C-P lyase system protein PhnH [Antarctobacter heliothermus]SNT19617.1 alpha-D-ribose 1-methylphosphonate 5-triphosphate synthase subunit PhnH [Antarctobacter heliothermus]
MDAAVLGGGFADAPVESARAFRAAMTAMARPGAISTITGVRPPAPVSVAAGGLLLTLCDPDTGVHLAGALDCLPVRDWITFHTGAPLVSAEDCDFAVGDWESLQPVARFRAGTAQYPDRSATLIVELPQIVATGVRLTGPGIRDSAALSLPEMAAFQANAARFPLGWDAYFCAGDRLAALPRSTKVGG